MSFYDYDEKVVLAHGNIVDTKAKLATLVSGGFTISLTQSEYMKSIPGDFLDIKDEDVMGEVFSTSDEVREHHTNIGMVPLIALSLTQECIYLYEGDVLVFSGDKLTVNVVSATPALTDDGLNRRQTMEIEFIKSRSNLTL